MSINVSLFYKARKSYDTFCLDGISLKKLKQDPRLHRCSMSTQGQCLRRDGKVRGPARLPIIYCGDFKKLCGMLDRESPE